MTSLLMLLNRLDAFPAHEKETSMFLLCVVTFMLFTSFRVYGTNFKYLLEDLLRIHIVCSQKVLKCSISSFQ